MALGLENRFRTIINNTNGAKMKTNKLFIVIALLLILQACDIYDPYHDVDYNPPAVPSGIVVVNGDNRVDIYWNSNNERDLAGYNIYYSYTYDGKYTLIGSSSNNSFVDWDAQNGDLYYYAVTAYDYNGNESELSYDVVYGTPRPEGFNQSIFDFREFPNNSGYSFSNYSVYPYNNNNTDFFFENYNGDFYLDVWDDTDIRDMGPTNDIYDIEYAPSGGWSSTKDEVAIVGHTYVIWTWNNHYAKIRISSITNERVVFDWAYQLIEGEPMLKGTRNSIGNRNELTRSFSR
jgi:hypothetical protein